MPHILGRNANMYLLNDYYTFNTTARHHEAVKEGTVPTLTKSTKHQKWLFSLPWLYFLVYVLFWTLRGTIKGKQSALSQKIAQVTLFKSLGEKKYWWKQTL